MITKPKTNIIHTLSHMMDTDDLTSVLSYRAPRIPTTLKKHTFYNSVIRLFLSLHDTEPIDEDAIRRERLWCNPQIGTQKSTIHWLAWERAGASKVGDICHPTEGRLMSHIEIKEKFGIQCSFLEAMAIRLQIPLHWRKALTKEWRPPPLPRVGPDIAVAFQQATPIDLAALSAKNMYDNFIKMEYQISAAYNKWISGEDYVSGVNAQEWSEICKQAFTSSRETKLQSLQFKIHNRIIPCGVHLKQIRIRDTDECPLCREKDTTAHFFFHCRVVSTFWQQICEWFRKATSINLELPRNFSLVLL